MNIPLPEDLQSRIEFFGIKQMVIYIDSLGLFIDADKFRLVQN